MILAQVSPQFHRMWAELLSGSPDNLQHSVRLLEKKHRAWEICSLGLTGRADFLKMVGSVIGLTMTANFAAAVSMMTADPDLHWRGSLNDWGSLKSES